ncbi:hypothetical protein RNC76_003915 [Salmonella enterica subsp. enterica serovar Infantis]|uniref:hypothetical protein n=1 Tax=Salmonella enterica TaxID=28901 RepID=UPI000A194803|nr:hypothetical protein [Salmonella enterica]ELF1494034.1 hypothetical protein [Salmonella enterica subsp. enterica serovar Infantis]ECH1932519.1 hypothetical protein [Salmonella enterica]ECX5257810.1 hypothetical protein [Salmonella enterica]EGF0824509.1 hypothetical protein [Salmonella enterica]EHS7656638.1 hypothetical protein [Salmonella enterica]
MKDNSGNKPFKLVAINKSETGADAGNKGGKMGDKNICQASYHKLSRARNISFWMNVHVRQLPANVEPLMWLPDIFSYISEDVESAISELEERGVFVQGDEEELI